MLPKNSLWITIFALSAFSFLSACPSEKTETGEEETDADADGDTDADADSDADSDTDSDSDSDSDADADADADADTDADADGPTCEDVQNGVIAVDETVTLDGLIVTSPVSSAPPGFFVQDAGGGPNHCLFVYLQPGKASINTGDIVSVTGLVANYYDLMEIKVTDLADVTVTGTGTPTVDTLSATPGDWEPYESCLLELEGITVLKAADYGEATTSWGINIDDLFFPWKGTPGTAYSSITGPLYYSYETFKIEPRGNSDLAL